jgi:hypothetical protein
MVEDKTKKLRLDLVPPEMEEALAKVLAMGAEKYSEHEWEEDRKYDLMHMASALRHIHAWRKGELTDPESGLCHLKHAFCRLGMMVTIIERDE